MRSRFHFVTVSVLVPALLAAAGCQQGIYRARSLPPEFAAVSATYLGTFDLTRLGSSPVSTELIHSGDALRVTVSLGIEDNAPSGAELMVSRDGTIPVPVLGPVYVAGRSLAEAAEVIRQESIRRDIYRDPTVALAFGARAVHRVTVDGAVAKPGTYELPAGTSTLSTALAAAGGLSDKATPFLEIRHPASHLPPNGQAWTGGTEINQVAYHPPQNGFPSFAGDGLVRLDLIAVQYGPEGNAGMNHYLRDGAVVTVGKTPARFVTVMGLTGNKVLPLAPERETRMLDAIAEVGGPRYSLWIADKVKIFRRVPGSGETITIVASMRKAKTDGAENLVLASGDVVSVEENIVTFTMDSVGKLLGIGVSASQAAYYGR